MSYSDDTAEFMFTGHPTMDELRPSNRKACKTCGNSLTFYFLCVDVYDNTWAFDCRRCGHTTRFTDSEVEKWV
jgi:RNase P subunit RPR2